LLAIFSPFCCFPIIIVIVRFRIIVPSRGIGVKKNFFGGVWVPAYAGMQAMLVLSF